MSSKIFEQDKERKEEYKINTMIIELDGKKVARKTAQTAKAVPHITQITQNRLLLLKNLSPNIYVCGCAQDVNHVDIECVEGKPLSAYILEAYFADGLKTAAVQFREFETFLNNYAQEYQEFVMNSDFKRIFGLVRDGGRSVRPGNIDLLPSNIIEKNGVYHVLNYEWVFDFPIPIRFVLFRAVARFYFANQEFASDCDEMLRLLGFDKEEVKEYQNMESHFEKHFFYNGSDNKGHLSNELNGNINHSLESEVIALKQKLVQNEEHIRLERVNAKKELLSQRDKLNQVIMDYRELAETQQRALDEGIGSKIRRSFRITAGNIYRRVFKKSDTRDAIKDYLFKIGKPLFKNKRLYKEWEASKDPEAARLLALETDPVSVRMQEFIDQIRDIPSWGNVRHHYIYKCQKPADQKNIDIKAIAFYLPQYHPIPENDMWWGEGFTEWTNVTKAMPQYNGHYQPRLPGDLGFYDLRVSQNIKKQMELAKHYGIYGFCLYYYWFEGKTLLDLPHKTILSDRSMDMPFCLCWANENWTRSWDGGDQDILMHQSYDLKSMVNFARDITPYLKDERYIRLNGKPLLLIYNPGKIVDIKNTVTLWREYFRTAGIGEINLFFIKRPDYQELDPSLADAFVDFPPHSVVMDGLVPNEKSEKFWASGFKGLLYDYKEIPRKKHYLLNQPEKTFKTVMLNWDNTARRGEDATIFDGFTIDAYKEWLSDLIKFTQENFNERERVVFINAWNEWAEGTYLEPDKRFGYAYLQATRDCLEQNKQKKIIFVSHDAYFHGAQLLSLNIIKQLTRNFGYNVYVILRQGGELVPEFEKYAKDIIQYGRDIENDEQFVLKVKSWNITKAICNTVVSGDILGLLADNGIECISLIHELPEIIHAMNAEESFRQIAEKAKKVVFPSGFVLEKDNTVIAIDPDKTVIRPQGLYKKNLYIDDIPDIRKQVRQELDLLPDTRIVLGVGIADRRKGVDLFSECAEKIENDGVCFVWVGNLDSEFFKETFDKAFNSGLVQAKRIIFIPPVPDATKYFAAADLYLLTSREDPFPSVIMEAMEVGVPVVAFDGCGGYIDIVNEETGMLVEKENADALAGAVSMILESRELLEKKSENCRRLIEKKFNFVDYNYYLLSLLNEEYKKVSVIVPNYNYSRYLGDRLDSIIQQTYPVFEIIILDDCSTDDSREVIREYQSRYPLQIKTILNDQNSRNVFSQWEKGIRAAAGDFIWIAEADDLCEKFFLQKNIERFMENSDLVMSYSQSKQIDSESRHLRKDYLFYTDDISKTRFLKDYVANGENEIQNALCVKNTIPNVSAILFKNVGLSELLSYSKDFKVAGDWMFYIKILERGGKIAYLRESLNIHRLHQTSMTRILDDQRHFEEIVKVQDYILSGHHLSKRMFDKVMEYRRMIKKSFGLDGNQDDC